MRHLCSELITSCYTSQIELAKGGIAGRIDRIHAKAKNSELGRGGGMAQWLAFLLLNPAARGSIKSISQKKVMILLMLTILINSAASGTKLDSRGFKTSKERKGKLQKLAFPFNSSRH